MDLATTVQLSSVERAHVQAEVDRFNARLNEGRESKQELGKDDFLLLLVTQLQNQDPTQPMEDKEFIAQMAQFSSLEQITNLGESFAGVSETLGRQTALSLLGSSVDIETGFQSVSGTVSAVTTGSDPQVRVGDSYYPVSDITRAYAGATPGVEPVRGDREGSVQTDSTGDGDSAGYTTQEVLR